MVNGTMVGALDWRPKNGDRTGVYTYRRGGVWRVETHGPGYSQLWHVTEYDDAGLKWLREHEIKEEPGAKGPTV